MGYPKSRCGTEGATQYNTLSPLAAPTPPLDAPKQYVEIWDYVGEGGLRWVDTREGLREACGYLAGVEAVGLDCEWRANHKKGEGENKVGGEGGREAGR